MCASCMGNEYGRSMEQEEAPLGPGDAPPMVKAHTAPWWNPAPSSRKELGPQHRAMLRPVGHRSIRVLQMTPLEERLP